MQLDFSTTAGKIRANNWYNDAKKQEKARSEKIRESHKKEVSHNMVQSFKSRLQVGRANKAFSTWTQWIGSSRSFEYDTWKKIRITLESFYKKTRCVLNLHKWHYCERRNNGLHRWEKTAKECYFCHKKTDLTKEEKER